jgi:hypothetical protein
VSTNSVRGEVIRESSFSKKESDAWKLLKKRHGEIENGKPIGPDIQKTTFENLAKMLTDDYRANARTSLPRAEGSVNHLRPFFGSDKAMQITSDRVTAYMPSVRKNTAQRAPSTANWPHSAECSLLRSEREKQQVNPPSLNFQRTMLGVF